MKYHLEVTKGQARIISQACELLARLHTGQLGELRLLNWPDMETRDVRETEGLCMLLKEHLFPGLEHPHSYHGINSQEIPDEARVAYDLHQVIRRFLAGPKPEGGFPYVIYDEPRRTSETEELAKMRVKKRTTAEFERGRLKFLLLAAATELEAGYNPLRVDWLLEHDVSFAECAELKEGITFAIRYWAADAFAEDS